MKSFYNLIGTLFIAIALQTISFTQWVPTNGPYAVGSVKALALKSTNIFAGTNSGGVYLSTDYGTNWNATALSNIGVYVFAVNGSNLFAGTYNHLFLSADNGTSWDTLNIPLTNYYVWALLYEGTNLFAGTDFGIFLSTDNGNNWTAVNNGLTTTLIYSFTVSGSNLFAGTSDGVFLSTNNGANWTAVNNGLTNTFVYSLIAFGMNIFAGTYGGGVFISTNNGTNWSAANNGMTSNYVYSFAVTGNNIFAGTSKGVFLSENQGNSWNEKNDGLNPGDMYAFSLLICDTNLFLGSNQSGVWKRPLSEMITSIDEEQQLLQEFSLSHNFPNPFNPSTKIKYSIPPVGTQHAVSVQIKVYDVLGNKIATVVDEEKPAGTYEVTWYAKDLPSGVYFYQLKAGDFIKTKKMILIK